MLLLNLADVRAVGHGALTGWRLDQVRRLYERVRDRLETLPSREETRVGFEERLTAGAGPDRAESAEVHAGLVPPRYRLEVPPEVAVQPETSAQIAAIMRHCTERRIPVTPRGGGTGLSGGAVPVHGGVSLSLARMNRILEIDTENLIVVVQPGVITQTLQEAVDRVSSAATSPNVRAARAHSSMASPKTMCWELKRSCPTATSPAGAASS